ncbi:MAG: hypothetical protein A2186_01470 [Candidatus Levybacteria bacterium RIFOXYA1_FULL_41_10]|nr:MAG: Beta-lactamase class A-like protein [Candidatus Levybacteria bacterium GW2011_GWA1_39_32]KKR51478.1 MAG: Beta-lactamase class A-like protein [Candidatus Levybacteria bacterium GW2011_GWC1_40_19]KKR73569.1 MAG: Beta-lactamase class A-like protein [Candidatus Levybacteria bacterium GW2011_GWC2_40_7]KKR95457.1 MAG: Beta-lactamase class A-like protein [Candidatus Levybacteria bacterium GW2011_GWA2_41_15]KKS01943.1 MAG: Beta-lactamase class A-like protein [Candidatus Levybacteria bacterium G
MPLKFVWLILPLIGIPLLLSTFAKSQIQTKVISPLVENIDIPFMDSGIKQIAQEELGKENNYAVVVKNLRSGGLYAQNENETFDSASLYKLWVMAVAFQKIKDGSLNENEVLSLPVSYLNDALSTTTPTPTLEGEIKPTGAPGESEEISMRTDIAIEKMITVSDNYAALLVASRSGTASIVNFIKGYGLKNSNFRQPPQTTAGDVALFFEKLYKKEVVDSEFSERMIDILKRQSLNDRIPKYLPESVAVAHKTGEIGEFKHDAGIVFGTKDDYIIVVLSKTKDPTIAAEKIAKFSEKVFEYFN